MLDRFLSLVFLIDHDCRERDLLSPMLVMLQQQYIKLSPTWTAVFNRYLIRF